MEARVVVRKGGQTHDKGPGVILYDRGAALYTHPIVVQPRPRADQANTIRCSQASRRRRVGRAQVPFGLSDHRPPFFVRACTACRVPRALCGRMADMCLLVWIYPRRSDGERVSDSASRQTSGSVVLAAARVTSLSRSQKNTAPRLDPVELTRPKLSYVPCPVLPPLPAWADSVGSCTTHRTANLGGERPAKVGSLPFGHPASRPGAGCPSVISRGADVTEAAGHRASRGLPLPPRRSGRVPGAWLRLIQADGHSDRPGLGAHRRRVARRTRGDRRYSWSGWDTTAVTAAGVSEPFPR
jgi:hypothetical protein